MFFSWQGNKKGPIGRWDFDTQEEYSDYMNQKEALPKAAFQYGVKMADGRKTRRIPGKYLIVCVYLKVTRST